MTELGLFGLPTLKTSKRNLANGATSEDPLNRNFIAQRPNQIWLTDITEHPTREGKLYCCVVLVLRDGQPDHVDDIENEHLP